MFDKDFPIEEIHISTWIPKKQKKNYLNTGFYRNLDNWKANNFYNLFFTDQITMKQISENKNLLSNYFIKKI